jgi:hypothetical protein
MTIRVIPFLILLFPLGYLSLRAKNVLVRNKSSSILNSSMPGEAVLAQGAIQRRLQAALEWIGNAQRASGDGGISRGYHLIRRRWLPSYPETTGYPNSAQRRGVAASP